MSTQSASGVLKRLITIYLTGSLAAVAVTFFLMMLGLQLTLAQWTLLALLTPLAVPGFVLVDVLVRDGDLVEFEQVLMRVRPV